MKTCKVVFKTKTSYDGGGIPSDAKTWEPGKLYELPQPSADYWVRAGKATIIPDEDDGTPIQQGTAVDPKSVSAGVIPAGTNTAVKVPNSPQQPPLVSLPNPLVKSGASTVATIPGTEPVVGDDKTGVVVEPTAGVVTEALPDADHGGELVDAGDDSLSDEKTTEPGTNKAIKKSRRVKAKPSK